MLKRKLVCTAEAGFSVRNSTAESVLSYEHLQATYNSQHFERNEFSEGRGLNVYNYLARVYDPQIGRWWSVDPLANEFFDHSPFIFVGNNPVEFIDPDGRRLDDYKLKQNGEIELIAVKPDELTDKIFATDLADRPILETSIEVDKDFLKGAKQAKDGRGVTFTFYQLSDDQESDRIFKFFADNTIKGEWSPIKYGSNKSYISTSGYNGQDGSGVTLTDYLLQNNFHVRSATHSHPSNTLGPSGFESWHKQTGDRDFAVYVHNQFPKSTMRFFVYEVKSGKLIEFNHEKVISK